VKWVTHSELEQHAEKIHRTFECTIPVDIDYIAEQNGLEIIGISRLKEDFGVWGLLGKVKKKFTIFIQRADFNLTNYHTNYTIAEELSHYFLHKEYFKNVDNIQEAFDFYTKISKKSEMMIELNAKYLAGALLIPRDDLIFRAKELYTKNEPLLNELLKKNNGEICEQIIAALSSRLSDVYRVPEGEICFRLQRKLVGFKEYIKGKCDQINKQ
jgi:Zn-dependent peptidase ImmA (M78 family)